VSDVCRPNRFEVYIHPPESFDGYTNDQFTLLPWLAESAQLPARTQGEITMKFHGMEYKLPGEYSKENITIGFINSYGWEARSFFDMWMEYLQSVSDDNSRMSAYTMLTDSSITVCQLGRTANDTLAAYRFFDVFPTNISAVDLNMSEYDSVEKFTVSFAYSHYVSLDVSEVNNG
jgi:hypothetical protein